MFKPTPAQAIRLSFNRAFRSPSVINNAIDVRIQLTDAQGKGLVFPLGAICQLNPALCASNPAVARQTIPLSTRLVGSDIPVGTTPARTLKEEALTAYELAYTGNFGRKATLGLAFYINDTDNNINFISSPATINRAGLPALYSSKNPPPGWPFPAFLLDLPQLQAAAFGRVPATFTYLNLGPIRQKGFESSLDYAFTGDITGFVNYSYQTRPKPLDADSGQLPYPQEEIGLPAKNRFNVGLNHNGRKFLGSVTVNYADKAFWSDVLTPSYHGFTDAYTLVNATVGWKWANGKVITSVKSTNILNEDIQQHIFGDVLKRSVLGEVRFKF
jgi:outer membrane receptor protein involved in Fe transport